MPKIVRAPMCPGFKNRDLLVDAIKSHGTAIENAHISTLKGHDIVQSEETFELVLQSWSHKRFTLGFRKEGGLYVPYHANSESFQQWAADKLYKVRCRYSSLEYRQEGPPSVDPHILEMDELVSATK